MSHDSLDKPQLLNHRSPSHDLAAALDMAPACQCLHCVYRREKAARERMIREAREMEAAS